MSAVAFKDHKIWSFIVAICPSHLYHFHLLPYMLMHCCIICSPFPIGTSLLSLGVFSATDSHRSWSNVLPVSLSSPTPYLHVLHLGLCSCLPMIENLLFLILSSLFQHPGTRISFWHWIWPRRRCMISTKSIWKRMYNGGAHTLAWVGFGLDLY